MAQSTTIQRFLLMFCCCYCTFAAPLNVIINPGDGINVGPVTPIMNAKTALNLFIQAEETMQMCKTIEDRIIVLANDSSIELPNFINKYCYFQTFVGSSDCDASDPTKLKGDLQTLLDSRALLYLVIEYQESLLPNDDFFLTLSLGQFQNKLDEFILSFNTTLNPTSISSSGDDNSNGLQIPPTGNPFYQQITTPTPGGKPSHCYNCTTLADQYLNIKELHTILQVTTSDIGCVKDAINSHSTDDSN
ncbi:PREDICTED: uncharacterized protein LOC109580513 [Amphimedon queenslandica]|uniref:Uncharacterized protein n=1 Tax=Amphimedon queenslandica TaxID=400682 RepID=A0A1X7VEK2_AMPQE|nr:PREDICTED: uncharacterized protein LOC109580513 [Amphimedon queenslandica]|eukprot:XP_019849346.1 PREDICTED: uncharacterized protein LOC109580513 [Amphimedon queenslandica]